MTRLTNSMAILLLAMGVLLLSTTLTSCVGHVQWGVKMKDYTKAKSKCAYVDSVKAALKAEEKQIDETKNYK